MYEAFRVIDKIKNEISDDAYIVIDANEGKIIFMICDNKGHIIETAFSSDFRYEDILHFIDEAKKEFKELYRQYYSRVKIVNIK